MEKTSIVATDSIQLLNKFIKQGGAEVWEYQALDYLIEDIYEQVQSGKISNEQLLNIRESFGEAFSTKTMQGFAFSKPYGYSGDFEIIERIYNYYIAPDPALQKWDLYWQNQPAARAVRNRKIFFVEQMQAVFPNATGEVLNLASGPCSGIKDYFDLVPTSQIHFDCLDMDKNAIAYASKKLEYAQENLHFIHQNIFKFQPTKQYDLIWSAGLFDYFDDKTFKKILARLEHGLSSKGIILIGNFTTCNKSKPYMELFDWHLNYRDAIHLQAMAREVYSPTKYNISILSEREGVNYF